VDDFYTKPYRFAIKNNPGINSETKEQKISQYAHIFAFNGVGLSDTGINTTKIKAQVAPKNPQMGNP